MKKVIFLFAIASFVGCDKNNSTTKSETKTIKVKLPESETHPDLSNACTIEITKDDSLYISWLGHERELIQWDDLETNINDYKKEVKEDAICSVKCDDDVTVGSLKKMLSIASKLEIKAILNTQD
jgi:biopolymer transport protein ExbD